MELTTKVTSDSFDISIIGNIKTIADGASIKEVVTKAIHDCNIEKPINLYIKDSFIITSSIIGFLIKVTNVDKIPLQVIVENQELYEMLSEMNLLASINIKKG